MSDGKTVTGTVTGKRGTRMPGLTSGRYCTVIRFGERVVLRPATSFSISYVLNSGNETASVRMPPGSRLVIEAGGSIRLGQSSHVTLPDAVPPPILIIGGGEADGEAGGAGAGAGAGGEAEAEAEAEATVYKSSAPTYTPMASAPKPRTTKGRSSKGRAPKPRAAKRPRKETVYGPFGPFKPSKGKWGSI